MDYTGIVILGGNNAAPHCGGNNPRIPPEKGDVKNAEKTITWTKGRHDRGQENGGREKGRESTRTGSEREREKGSARTRTKGGE